MSRFDNFFTDLENTTPYFKVAAEGAAGSGKTFTLALTVAGLYKHIGATKPIVIFDTERSAKFLSPFFKSQNIPVLLKDSRSLTDLITTMDYCNEGNAEILIIDSITHVWEGFLNAYQQKKGRSYLQFQDWGFIKPTWKREYSDRLVMGRYHILFTGREGYTYDYQTDENGKRELVKTGVKMKVEGDTAYEPDLLFRMERFEKVLGDKKEIWREATVIKDRANLIDGKTFKNPTFEDFMPVVAFLLSDVVAPTDTVSHSDHDLIGGEEDNRKERTDIKIQLERNNALLDKVATGTGKAEKAMKLALMDQGYMGETSELAVSRMNLAQLEHAHEALSPLVEAIALMLRREPFVYPVAKAIDAARDKYLDTRNPGEARLTAIEAYNEHMKEKYTEIQAKEAAKEGATA